MTNRRIAVLIGNKEFPQEPGLGQLQYPLNDVDGMVRVLGSKERGRFDEVIVLTDKTSHEIRKKLEEVFKAAARSDLILLYYAGHGQLSRPSGRLHLAANDTILAKLNTTSISIGFLKELIEDAETRKIIIILDCCHSGAVKQTFLRGSSEDELRQLSEGSGIFIMTACASFQQAEENPADRHGIFTKHIIDGIERGAADDNNDGVITMAELYHYVEKRVGEEQLRQQPTQYGLDLRGELVIARIGEEQPREDNRDIPSKLSSQPEEITPSKKRIAIYAAIMITVLAVGGASIYSLIKSGPASIKIVQKETAAEREDGRPSAFAKASLTIIANPESATIRILNIKDTFYQGMQLPPGKYHIEVAANRYETKRQWIAIDSGENVKVPIKLARIIPAPKIVNKLGMEMIYIRPGAFIMGSPPDENGRAMDEIRHEVTLTKGFYMQTTEVTQGQWKAVMGSNPSHFKDCGETCPVESISWRDVQIFTHKLNLLEKGLAYRLPTEAEWEYAVRAGSKTGFSFGDEEERLKQYAWFVGNSRGMIHPVAEMRPNQLSLFDMHGNVWEWVGDWYGNYPQNRVTDPGGPPNGTVRVVRGGSWSATPESCRSAFRNWDTPYSRFDDLGFRLAGEF